LIAYSNKANINLNYQERISNQGQKMSVIRLLNPTRLGEDSTPIGHSYFWRPPIEILVVNLGCGSAGLREDCE